VPSPLPNRHCHGSASRQQIDLTVAITGIDVNRIIVHRAESDLGFVVAVKVRGHGIGGSFGQRRELRSAEAPGAVTGENFDGTAQHRYIQIPAAGEIAR